MPVARSMWTCTSRRPQSRAIAAAASLIKPDTALLKAKEAKENPENIINPQLDEVKLNELISAVNQVQDNSADAPTPNDEQIAAARSVGVSPVLVRAALDKMEENNIYVTTGIDWVAAVDANLLESAARAGTKVKLLDLVPSQQDRITKLEKKVNSLDARVSELEKVRKNEPKQQK